MKVLSMRTFRLERGLVRVGGTSPSSKRFFRLSEEAINV